MPTSDVARIPVIINAIMKVKDRVNTILDVGCGFGKYGFLLREYLDIWNRRYKKEKWKYTIDAIEVFEEYITPIHGYIYNHIYLGEASQVIKSLPNYNVILLCDVIEHFKKDKGTEFIGLCSKQADMVIISHPNITDPKIALRQGATFGNEYERHKSIWTIDDFSDYKTDTFCDGGVIIISGGIK